MKSPAFRGPLNSTASIRAARAAGMTKKAIVRAAVRSFDAGQPALRSSADAEWVAGQLARRRKFLAERVLPLLEDAGMTVDAERAAGWIETMDTFAPDGTTTRGTPR